MQRESLGHWSLRWWSQTHPRRPRSRGNGLWLVSLLLELLAKAAPLLKNETDWRNSSNFASCCSSSWLGDVHEAYASRCA